MVKSGRISVFPKEIEDALRRHPAFADGCGAVLQNHERLRCFGGWVHRVSGAR